VRRAVKIALYRAARTMGMFSLARRLTRKRVRILAYHGFETRDEAGFRGKMFIRSATLERRLAHLAGAGFRVVSLDHAVAALAVGGVEDDLVVITIDDGFATTLSVAAPLLHRHGFPATVYLTSYHMRTQTPVFDLLLGYMLWKSGRDRLDLAWPDEATPRSFDLSTPERTEASLDALIDLGRELPSEEHRMRLHSAVADALGVDLPALLEAGLFRLMTADEAKQIQRLGVDVGLHTHRHHFPPMDMETCRREIADNRRFLRESGIDHTEHFCYPSGIYAPHQWPVLDELGVRSSTTCETGLAGAGDPRHGLRRFLDGESVSDIEFEAELSGFSELLRAASRRARTKR
jgi:peptidoglycan/xylan/chitin deacetylase (PgdA/CDA1 family)